MAAACAHGRAMWASALVLLFVAYIVVSMIPLVNFFVQLLVPFAYAGIALAGDEQRRTGSFELGILLVGFEEACGALVAVGGTVIVAYVVIRHLRWLSPSAWTCSR